MKIEQFSEKAQRVLSLAQAEAQRRSHNHVGTEHLLLGVVSEPDGAGAVVLSNLGVELSKVRAGVGYIIGRAEASTGGETNLTPPVKRAIELAVDEAFRLNHQYIGTDHLLIGLMREGGRVANGVLENHGVSLDKVRHEASQLLL